MTDQPTSISAELPCHRCEYDLRAHPADGICPECGASVAESIRWNAIPRRPAWRDSDLRWRRRMVAGMWILVLMPLERIVHAFQWSANLPMPTLFDFRGPVLLSDTFLFDFGVYELLIFCIGMVLLFSKERGRHPGKLDWTRRWGVICSYVVLLLNAAQVLFIAALMLAGISALFISMPPKYQPHMTRFFIEVSTRYLRYGPYPHDSSVIVQVAFSSITMLLACIALFDALRSSLPKWLAAIVLAPLAIFSMMHLLKLTQFWLGDSTMTEIDLWLLSVYFRPYALVSYIKGNVFAWLGSGTPLYTFIIEATKWCSILAIAIWLTIAQFLPRRRANKPPVT